MNKYNHHSKIISLLNFEEKKRSDCGFFFGACDKESGRDSEEGNRPYLYSNGYCFLLIAFDDWSFMGF